jgi:translocation and assembly module TamA
VSFVPSYNLEVYELDHVTNLPNPNNPNQPLVSPLLTSCQQSSPQSSHGVCLLSYLEQRIQWDGRDDPINTRRGFYTELQVQEGSHVGGYGYQFLKFVPEGRIYLPVGERSVLAARARLGAFIPVNETGTPPTVALFRSGGANSMRGYGQDRLSPMACVPTTVAAPTPEDPNHTKAVCSNQWYPVGGNGLAQYSLEFRFPIRGNLFGATFTDAGYVSAPSAVPTAYRDAFDPAKLQWALGFGIRYRTPVGPLRFDIAARLPENLARRTNFTDRFPTIPQGGFQIPNGDFFVHREPIIAFHLTIGEAF